MPAIVSLLLLCRCATTINCVWTVLLLFLTDQLDVLALLVVDLKVVSVSLRTPSFTTRH